MDELTDDQTDIHPKMPDEEKGSKPKTLFSKLTKKFERKKKSKEKKSSSKPPSILYKSFSSLDDTENSESSGQEVSSQSEEETSDWEKVGNTDGFQDYKAQLSSEIWNHGKWKAWIMDLQASQQEKDPICTIQVEDMENPESMHWKVNKSLCEFKDLQTQLLECLPTIQQHELPSLSGLQINQNELVDATFVQTAKIKLNNFLEKLLSDYKNHEEVFQFLCPSTLTEDETFKVICGFLTTLFSYEEPDKDDEVKKESSGPFEECVDPEGDDANSVVNPETFGSMKNLPSGEADLIHPEAEGSSENSVSVMFRALDPEADIPSFLPSQCITASDMLPSFPSQRSHKVFKPSSVDNTVKTDSVLSSKKENDVKLKKTKDALGEAIWKLLKVIFDDSIVMLKIIQGINILRLSLIQSHINYFLQDDQVASLIGKFKNNQWPNGEPAAPPPVRKCEEKHITKQKAEELLLKKITKTVVFADG
nr:PREDICTED: uncharacterized protein LOC102352514 [Latimeria chalumnae]|eukprot:XP_014348695.1 PREDICTED: uncharacterized protein LOC102352514 [Latimeria chalumnae]